MSTSDGLGGSPGRDQLKHLRSRKPIKYGAEGEAAMSNLRVGQQVRAARNRQKTAQIKAKQRVITGSAVDGLTIPRQTWTSLRRG